MIHGANVYRAVSRVFLDSMPRYVPQFLYTFNVYPTKNPAAMTTARLFSAGSAAVILLSAGYAGEPLSSLALRRETQCFSSCTIARMWRRSTSAATVTSGATTEDTKQMKFCHPPHQAPSTLHIFSTLALTLLTAASVSNIPTACSLICSSSVCFGSGYHSMDTFAKSST